MQEIVDWKRILSGMIKKFEKNLENRRRKTRREYLIWGEKWYYYRQSRIFSNYVEMEKWISAP